MFLNYKNNISNMEQNKWMKILRKEYKQKLFKIETPLPGWMEKKRT